MRSTSSFLSSSIAIALCAAACGAQSVAPPAQSAPSVTTVVSTDVPDNHEDQSTTRSVSQIRIVRLSQVRGSVQLDRSTGQKFEAAFTNLPIITGEQLRTQEGVAEVEFEDNSSLRIVTDSQVDFPQLGRDAYGTTTTTVNLVRGSMYLSLANTKTTGNFIVHVGNETLTPEPASHLRVDIDGSTAKITVFQGTVTAASGSGSLVVGKHKAATFDLTAGAVPTLARMDEPSPFDAWDKNAVEYHKTLAVAATYANSPFSYGVNDLAYYGSFSNVGGCGTMWRPYLAGASFDPYASGIWTWYPTSGYSWVSPYPWGWTPYHSGSWSNCGGAGWGWQPQGGWNGLQNVPATAAIAQRIKIPGPVHPRPPLPPIKGQPTIVTVNLNKLQISKPGTSGESFVFQRGSAGLGVPRGVFNNLGKMSQHATERGFATTSISETQAARGLMPTSTASISASRNGQMNGQTNSSTFARSQGLTSASAGRSNAVSASTNNSMSNSMSNSSAGSRSFSSAAPSAPSGGAPSGGGGAHPH